VIGFPLLSSIGSGPGGGIKVGVSNGNGMKIRPLGDVLRVFTIAGNPTVISGILTTR